jgi:uncharacterized membrane protein YoaK (UPF0700 family)
MSTVQSIATRAEGGESHTAPTPSRSEQWLSILLSVIAGMVDLIGFLSLGVFTAHVTGNIVVITSTRSRCWWVRWQPIFLFQCARS